MTQGEADLCADERDEKWAEDNGRERSTERIDRERRPDAAVAIARRLCELGEERAHRDGGRQECRNGDAKLGAKTARHRARQEFLQGGKDGFRAGQHQRAARASK